MKSQNRGFTLIELLVVIAIIGLLAAVVLAAVGSARNKGGNASVGSNMQHLRLIAEVYAQGNRSSGYSGFCTGNNASGQPGAVNTIAAVMIANGTASGPVAITALATAGASTRTTCHVSAANDAWAIETPLLSPNTGFWCSDSNGYSGTTTTTSLGASITACSRN